jgi:GDP-D-mannose dehydratase
MLEAINRVMDIALKHQATLLHASTSEVYGDALAHPQVENYWDVEIRFIAIF